jgi:4-alpha-glucanotransferase
LPPGYHHLQIGSQEILVISAPRQAYFPFQKKEWGVFVPVYALHSTRTPAAGDLTDFEHIMSWIAKMGGHVAATLPLLATFLDEPFEPSPYGPASRLFWNEFYTDIARVPEAAQSADAKRLMEIKPRRTRLVDYRAHMAAKRQILEKLARTFFSSASGSRRDAFERFVESETELADYARFRAVTDRLKSGWTTWPSHLREGRIESGDYSETDHRYHLYSQWIVQEQLKSLSENARQAGTALYLDLPLGLHPESYDVWNKRNIFMKGVSGGAPPDLVFTKGQNWGFPPMHPEAMRMSRYQYTIAYIRNHLRYARLLRIDHVMGLHRLYCIPDGQTGDKGVYVHYPADDLYAILSLESHRHQAGIVGENLGTVPSNVNTAMARHNIQKMYVVQYEIAGDIRKSALKTPPRSSVASLNTHDMAPFRAFWDSIDISDRLDLGFIDRKAAHEERKQRTNLKKALIHFLQERQFLRTTSRLKVQNVLGSLLAFLAANPSKVVLVNLEDLWQEIQPQNVPSTQTERPNWRRLVRPAIEEIRQMPEVVETLQTISNLRNSNFEFEKRLHRQSIQGSKLEIRNRKRTYVSD